MTLCPNKAHSFLLAFSLFGLFGEPLNTIGIYSVAGVCRDFLESIQGKKGKFGVHDDPVFLQQCDDPVYSSIFEAPREDPFREGRLEWLKKNHPKIAAYGEMNPDILSCELMLTAALSEKFQIDASQSIAFIGATDGELTRLFSKVFGIQKMIVIDLKPCLERTAKKLFELSIDWITPDQIKQDLEIDLVISGTTFCRLSESWQKDLFEKVFSKAKGGSLFYQLTPRHWGIKSWKKEKFLGFLKKRFEIPPIEQGFLKALNDDADSFILFLTQEKRSKT